MKMTGFDVGRKIGSAMAIASAATLAVFMTVAHAEQRLRAVAALPPSENTTDAYKEFINLVNERGKGVVQIDLVGGPEVIPGNQQFDAVRRGAVDVANSPAGYVLGSFPEVVALVGSTVTPLEARQNGGFEILQTAFLEKLGVHLLSRLAPASEFNLFLVNEPKRTEDGGLDLSGLRIRSSPLFKAFVDAQNAVPVVVAVPDIYTGLERGTFDGMGYPVVSLKGFSWERFLKYRIDPGFFQTDLAIVVNPAKWEAIGEEGRKILTEVAAEYEQKSYEDFQALSGRMKSELEEQDGMKTITLEGEAAEKYLDSAYAAAWDLLKASDSTYYDVLREKFYDR